MSKNPSSRISRWAGAALLALTLAGCATMPDWVATSGASREQVLAGEEESAAISGVEIIQVDNALAKKLASDKTLDRFSDVFPGKAPNHYVIGAGDVLEVSIWEAPPAMLFGSIALDTQVGATTTNAVTFPEQMVAHDGMISIPFAGRIRVKGRKTQDIEQAISGRLKGKANDPQVMVRVIQNNTSNVTVVGEVGQSLRMPLTPQGERLLDALAAGGGVTQPVNRMAIQLSRNDTTATMALDSIIRDPRQNIALAPGDVVTALHQPRSFSALGATGKNEEIPFEAQGISLVQALARSGGLNDNRADARGVFIFRFEDAALIGAQTPEGLPAEGLVPVVYIVNLRDPGAFFVTQNFPMQDKDVIYVTNAPAAEFQKFLRLVVSVAVPTVTLNNALN